MPRGKVRLKEALHHSGAIGGIRLKPAFVCRCEMSRVFPPNKAP